MVGMGELLDMGTANRKPNWTWQGESRRRSDGRTVHPSLRRRDLSGFASDDTPKSPRGVFAITVNAGKSQKLMGATLWNRSRNKMADIEMASEILPQ